MGFCASVRDCNDGFVIVAGKVTATAVAAALLTAFFSIMYNMYDGKAPLLDPSPRVVAVVGSGLAGTVTALTAAEELSSSPKSRVIVFEKEPRTGGNSMKASSGINALNLVDSDDSEDKFAEDVLKSGRGLSSESLVRTLVKESSAAMDFLQGQYGIDLNTTLQLGGHSIARTHCPHNGMPVGFAIMKRLSQALAELPNVEIWTSTHVTDLRINEDEGNRIMLKYVKHEISDENSKNRTEEGLLNATAVVLATGGYSANAQLLQKYAPNAVGLPTTNGYFAQGDGLNLGRNVGGTGVQLDSVQIHPTAFVDPKDPDNPIRFLCPERMRGIGGVLLNAEGSRFVNELEKRDVVTNAIRSQPHNGIAFLVLGHKAAATVDGALSFYVKRGFFQKCETIAEVSKFMSTSEEKLRQEFDKYDTIAKHGEVDDYGKSVFPALIEAGEGPLYVAEVSPAIHYTMGGLKFDTESRVLDAKNNPIPGIFAVGEVTGGLHGANRLAGNSLLECVVFGRKAGKNAALS